MTQNQNSFSFCLFVCLIIALLIFLVGFFQVDQNSLTNGVNSNQFARGDPSPHTNSTKLVLFIVDAMRYDFVDPKSNNHMPFLQTSISDGKSCLLKTAAAAPTVTMPRIKAITSGAIPKYLDIVMNLGSSVFNEDTFLYQAKLQGLRSAFYGDDTWIKMFPTMFTRCEGTHSYFAADFWEVDKNVTVKLEEELIRSDWDILILHYLGLDHIGHIEGPKSIHVPAKLAEMDSVAKKLWEALKNQNSLIIMTGDHGMKDSGGHGGVTDGEVYVPLLSVGQPCYNVPGWPPPDEHIPQQIDLASTISNVLKLPIPKGNMGKLIPALLAGIRHENLLEQLERNKLQLSERRNSILKDELKEKPNDAGESMTPRQETMEHQTAKYFVELSELSQQLAEKNCDFNLAYMTFSCSVLWGLLIAFFLFLPLTKPYNALQLFLTFGTVGHALSLASSSFIEEEHQTWYFLWATFLLLALRERLRRKAIVGSYVVDIKSCSIITMCLLQRFLRRLNQTGDKWAHLPDWEDVLRSNKLLLFLLFTLSLIWLFTIFAALHGHILEKFLSAFALLCIVGHRFAVDSFQFSSTFYPISRGTREVAVFYTLLGTLVLYSAYQSRNMSWLWGLMVALTLRPHNVILVPAMIFSSQQLCSILSRENVFWNTLAHMWLGNLIYFYQGHSNSLSNIDVAPAFIGTESYTLWYAAILTAVHTYAGPIYCFLLSSRSISAILLTRLLPLTLYCTLTYFQRHHLFVWSVFSPKLLLEAALTAALFLTCVIGVTKKFNSKVKNT